MSFNKKDLEIAYSLRWKNGPKRDDKEVSIISVYDIPATTLNFEVFKSYLLKNSGTPEQDVRVSYIMDNGREYPIQSQTDFHVALYAFRRKARSGELINLLLEKISEQPVHKNLRHSNDVETQIENMEPSSLVSTCCNSDTPPEWFISYMAQMKKDITEEITATVSSVVSSALSSVKPQIISQPPCHHHSRKSKPEKRSIRKITPLMVETTTDAKDLIKSLKLDNKLEKLERKASKYREKRLALQNAPKSSDSEAGHSSSRSRSRDKGEKQEEEPKMDAKPVDCQTAVPHMLGGEVYMHQWEVENTGEAQWTSKTILQFTWGSKSLKPLNKTISVPWLKPGEKGTVSVRLQIPKEAGKYECYWQFMHKERRFGHWLGCQVIVDPFDLKGHRSVLDTARIPIQEHSSSHPDAEDLAAEDARIQDFLRDIETPKTSTAESVEPNEPAASGYTILHDEKIAELSRELANNMEKINLHENLDSDSACSLFGAEGHVEDYFSSGNSSKDEFVVVPVPKCFLFEGKENADQQVENCGEKVSSAPQKATEQQPGSSGFHVVKRSSIEQVSSPGSGLEVVKKSSSERVSSHENNFDDNNNAENGSVTPGNSIKLKDEDFDNIVVITVPKDEQVKEGYIYVHVDGTKVLIPKNILKSEVVNAAQELEKSPGSKKSIGVIVDSNETINQTPTPTPSTQTLQASPQSESKKEDENEGNTTDSAAAFIAVTPQKPDNVAIDMTMSSMKDNFQNDEPVDPSNYFEANNYMWHCSAAGSCFSEANSQAERNSRLFIFPEHVPGYEVVNPEPFVAPTMPMPMPYNIPPTANPFVEHVPNFQQTPPDQRHAPIAPTAPTKGREAILETFGGVTSDQSANQPQERAGNIGVSQETGETNAGTAQVHILPETLVSGAVNVASSAFSTARSVINMIKPQSPGRWINGHWVSNSPETPREANLQALAEMGFWNRDLNATLLARFDDDLNRVVAELVQ